MSCHFHFPHVLSLTSEPQPGSCDMKAEGEITSKLYIISGSYGDLMSVYAKEMPAGSLRFYTYKIVEGIFTGFDRIFTEDELFN